MSVLGLLQSYSLPEIWTGEAKEEVKRVAATRAISCREKCIWKVWERIIEMEIVCSSWYEIEKMEEADDEVE